MSATPGKLQATTLILNCILHINAFNCRGGIRPEMAIRLSIALKTSSEMWLNLQATYDLWLAEKARKKISKKVQVVEEYIEKHQSAA